MTLGPHRFTIGLAHVAGPFLFVVAIVLASAGCGRPIAASPAIAPHAARFIDDDYATARAEARAAKKLLFVDAWAPWCHSCLSLRSFVLQDPRLGGLADRYTWLAIDTENAKNDAFVRKFPNRAWPTLYVVEPENETVLLSWPGTMTAAELETRLVEVAKRRQSVELPEAAVLRLSEEKAYEACVDLAARGYAGLHGTSRAAVVATGIDCATEAKTPTGRPLLDEAAKLVVDASLLADDRSSMFESMIGYLDAVDSSARATLVAESWALFLEGEATRATSPAKRVVFDAHRVLAYLRLRQPARAIPMLEQSAKDFPTDYNAHARLAKVLLEMRDLERAEREARLAATLVYGPRALRVFSVLADVLEARRRPEEAAATLSEALSRTQGMPLTPAAERLRAAMRQRKDALTEGR